MSSIKRQISEAKSQFMQELQQLLSEHGAELYISCEDIGHASRGKAVLSYNICGLTYGNELCSSIDYKEIVQL